MKFSKNIIYPIILTILLFSCEKQQNIEIAEINVINDVFLELVKEKHIYQDQDDFIKEYYIKSIDSISVDSMNVLYQKNKKVLKYGTLLLKDKLTPFTKEEKELLVEIDRDNTTIEYSIINDDSIAFDLDDINNRGSYTIIKGTGNHSNIGKDAMSSIRFSRVYFNNKKNSAAFIYEIICGELCYSRNLILVNRDKNNRWFITKGYPIEIG